MSNCICNIIRIPKKQKTGKSFNFSIWDHFSAYENNEEKQDFVEYEKNLYACIKSVGIDDINPKEDTEDGQKCGEYWVRAVSGIKGDNGSNIVLRINDNWLQWKYDFEEIADYRNLYNLENVIEQLSLELVNEDSYNCIRLKNGENEISIVKIPILADDSVTTPKIADASVTTPKIADAAITKEKIAGKAVTISKIADGAVISPKIANTAVTEPKLSEDLQNKVNNNVKTVAQTLLDNEVKIASKNLKFRDNNSNFFTDIASFNGAIKGSVHPANSIFGNHCQDNTFGSGCQFNTFENYCSYNTFEAMCLGNIFGNYCQGNTFGDNCQGNIVGNYCQGNIFGSNLRYCKIDNGVSNIELKSNASLTARLALMNIHILSGVKGNSNRDRLIINIPDEYLNSSRELIITTKVTNGGVSTTADIVMYYADEVLNHPIELTYSKLKALRDAKKLIAGQAYRITDFVTTSVQTDTRSAGHPFDIIVVADDESTLNEVARAIKHEGDTYFANSNLSAWKIWYCLDNDTTRFAWADETNGKGVIYRMIDEFDNDCPYDFKNIQFARWELSNPVGYRNDFNYDAWEDNWIQESTPFDSLLERGFWGLSSANNKFYYIYDSTDGIYKYKVEYTISGSPTYCYTFGKDTDYSINGSNYSNVIKEYKSNNTIRLNNIVFLGSDCYSNTFGENCYSNTFGGNCYSNTFGGNCYSNTFGEIVEYNESEDKTIIIGCTHNSFDNNCYYNIFSGNCNYNNLGNDCHNNYFGNYSYKYTEFAGCNSNTFGNECYENCFDNNCNYNTFGDRCYSNTFGDSCYYNTFGGRCDYNTFGAYCDYNTFGAYCDSNTFGDNCRDNSFENDCSFNSFGNDCGFNSFGNGCVEINFASTNSATTKYNYYQYNHFGDGCEYILFKGEETASYNAQVMNYNFNQGLRGNGGSYLTINGVRNRNFETKVGKDSNGNLKIFCLADLIYSESDNPQPSYPYSTNFIGDI